MRTLAKQSANGKDNSEKTNMIGACHAVIDRHSNRFRQFHREAPIF